MLGIEAESLGSQLAAYFGVKDGVLVRSVIKDSAAEKAGIKAGDVITKIDGIGVTTPNEVSSAVRSASSNKTFSVELVREHKDTTLQREYRGWALGLAAGSRGAQLVVGGRAVSELRLRGVGQGQTLDLQQEFHFFAGQAECRGNVGGGAPRRDIRRA